MSEFDGLDSAEIADPNNPEELARILKESVNSKRLVAPRGGSTTLDLGHPLPRVDPVIWIRRLDQVLDHPPANLTVRSQAGISLDELNQRLAEHGQCVPLDPPCPSRATIGGILATNASGPLGLRHGTARDHLIGIRAALPIFTRCILAFFSVHLVPSGKIKPANFLFLG